jgi:ribosome-associated toxin RatA of RatAB toxin-antitoxin module
MFELVDAVETYPDFLPWCDGAGVLHRDEASTRATLRINYHGIRQSFTTDNTKEPPHAMTMRLV